MGFLSKLFNNYSTQNNALSVRKNELQTSENMLTIHPDIRNYLWVADGKFKNYFPRPSDNVMKIDVQGITITISFGMDEEPSLIYMKLPIGDTRGSVERPPYYPTYKGLTVNQRGMYWKLLNNPYDNTLDIGYVFILYYGLERYLLTDSYEEVIDVILKLRDVHQNKSFQSYSANAVILTCMYRQRADIAQKFMMSLDKDYEFNFSPNLFLICKYSLGLPLYGVEIMRFAKAFGFTKNNYIKKYPKLFIDTLNKKIKEKYKLDAIPWGELITTVELKQLPKEETPIFANVSIRDKTIKVPILVNSNTLKQVIYNLLDTTHEDVKKQLAENRKKGKTTPGVNNCSSKSDFKEVLTFDNTQEELLLNNYKKTKDDSLEQHFASMAIQNFYYKYRNLDHKYIEKCVEYCKDDISRLSDIQRNSIEDEKKKIMSQQWLSQAEKTKQISEIRPFYADIPAFKRLAIIYEKEHNYDEAINICNQAISYYNSGNIQSEVSEFSKRKQKLLDKRGK